MADRAQPNSAILHEAASWLAQIDNDELSAEDKLALAEWMHRSPVHAVELRKMSALWGEVDQTIDEAIAQSRSSKIKGFSFLASIIRVKPAYVYASVVLVILGLLSFNLIPNIVHQDSTNPQYVRLAPLIYSVDKGERLTKTLQDGSIVHMNTDSVVEVNYTAEYRQLNLIRGEVLFDVKKDPRRPFQVLAKGKITEAIGTKFIIRIDHDDVAVTVTEGRVKLGVVKSNHAVEVLDLPKGISSNKLIYLDAGQSASVIEDTLKVAELEPVVLERKTAWLDDEFVFSGESLAHVVDEISRYNNVDINIAPELRSKPIGGRFRTTDVDRILEALELSEGIKVSRSADGAIYLSQ